MKKIFIDPGHGGSDPGATENGLREKDICLKLALLLRDILQEKFSGHLIKLSRVTDQTVPLRDRTNFANRWGAHYLISIHVNAGRGTGFESYIFNGNYKDKPETKRLQKFIHDEIVGKTRLRDRGMKEANFHMLRESKMPAVLTENGFIDHKHDASFLKDKEFLRKIAFAHAIGVAKALGLQSKNEWQNNHSTNNSLIVFYHEVQRGETFWNIGRKYGVSVEQLMEWNPGIIPKQIQIGERLKVYLEEGRGTFHQVKGGDTLWRLAIQYNTSVEKLLQLNRGIEPQRLKIGQSIRVRS